MTIKGITVILSWLAFLSFLSPTMPAWGQTPDKGDVAEAIKMEMGEKERQLSEVGRQEKLLQEELAEIDRSLERHQRELRNLSQELGSKITWARGVEARIDAMREKIEAGEARVKERLLVRYKFGRGALLGLIFSQDDLGAVIRKQKFMEVLLKADRYLIEEYRVELSALSLAQERLAREVNNVRELLGELKNKREQIQMVKERREELLRGLSLEKNRHLARLEELKLAGARLQGLVESLKSDLAQVSLGTGFKTFRGRLNPPLSGEVAGFFGKVEDPRFRTVTFNNGVQIVAPYGQEIRAVFFGRVVYSRPFKGYGNIVIIDHGEGFHTLYGYASKLLKKEGDIVTKDEVIALVGDNGTLAAPQLYFEVRYQGKPTDPLAWIKIP